MLVSTLNFSYFPQKPNNNNISATRLTGVAIQALVVYTGMPIYTSRRSIANNT